MEIISNTAIIAVNQDSLGKPAARIWKKRQEGGGDLQLWAGPLEDGSVPRLLSFHRYIFLW
jgi:alpha-galactosidase